MAMPPAIELMAAAAYTASSRWAVRKCSGKEKSVSKRKDIHGAVAGSQAAEKALGKVTPAEDSSTLWEAAVVLGCYGRWQLAEQLETLSVNIDAGEVVR